VNRFAELGSGDFFKLMIAELTNQDPLEPTDNQALLQQISSMREIELSTTLTDTLRSLTGQQRFSSASSLIGNYVTGMPGEDGQVHRGMVVGVRFAGDGRPMLQLSTGAELPMEQVATVESAERAAETLVGQQVVGVDRTDPSNPKIVEGEVIGVTIGDRGEMLLEMEEGNLLRFRDLTSVVSA
jgi:flagellar basal-body rod modification protein FlgD